MSTMMSELLISTRKGLFVASSDRGESWAAVSHHLPPVHAVAFAG